MWRNNRLLRCALISAALLILALVPALAEEEPEALTPIGTEPLTEPEAGLSLSMRGAVRDEYDVWHQAWDPEGTLVFAWEQEGAADNWQVRVTGPEGEADRAVVSVSTYSLAQGDLVTGAYTLSVTAYLNGDAVCGGSLSFVLEAEDSGDDPGGNTGGRPGGSRPGGRGGNRNTGIIPGTALSSAHAAGTKELLPYGAVRLTLPEGEMDTLILDGEDLGLNCGGAAFTAALEGDTLLLTSGSGDWAFTQAALKTLALSGVRTLALSGGTGTVRLDTDLILTGSAYARERSEGFAASDFHFGLDAEGFTVTVEDRVYRLEGDRLEDME